MEQWGNNGSALKEKWIHYKKCFNYNKKKSKIKAEFLVYDRFINIFNI